MVGEWGGGHGEDTPAPWVASEKIVLLPVTGSILRIAFNVSSAKRIVPPAVSAIPAGPVPPIAGPVPTAPPETIVRANVTGSTENTPGV